MASCHSSSLPSPRLTRAHRLATAAPPHRWNDPNEAFTELVLENFLVTVSQVTTFAPGYIAAQQNAQMHALSVGTQAEQPA